jgi:hypothetical protein
MYPYGPWFSIVDIHPVTVTKVAEVTQTQNAFAFGGLAVNSAVSSISQ